MTTIAAIQGEGWAVVGYDSLVVDPSESGRKYVLTKSNAKIVRNGDYIIGCAGDVRVLNLVSHVFKPPTPPRAAVTLDKFMTSVFVPALRACLEEGGAGKEGQYDSHLIVVVKGRVYELGEAYDWCRDERGIYSIGSGSAYALGSMYSTLPDKNFGVADAKKAAKLAIETAAKLDWGTGLPATVVVQNEKPPTP